jgi:hypothetical protein
MGFPAVDGHLKFRFPGMPQRSGSPAPRLGLWEVNHLVDVTGQRRGAEAAILGQDDYRQAAADTQG